METETKTKTAAKPLSNLELSAFCGQMALILQSGISSLEGLSILLEDAKDEAEKAILQQIYDEMMMSGDFAGALESTGIYPAYMVQMVRIGDETGNLDEVMQSLSDHYDREDSIARSIRSAVTYPMVMVVMMVLVILVLLVKVMPIFNQVFVQLGTEMTGFSRVLMNLGTAISRYGVVFTLLLAVIVGLVLYGTRTEKGKATCRKLGYKLAMTRAIYEDMAVCRFASGMALTLSSGITPDRSMEMVSALNDDPEFEKKLTACREQVDQGEDLSAALHEAGIFTGVYAQMASIGSKTGSMEKVMSRVAELYQDEIDARMSNALAVLEPTLVIGLSLVVGAILLSVMLPLLGIMSSI